MSQGQSRRFVVKYGEYVREVIAQSPQEAHDIVLSEHESEFGVGSFNEYHVEVKEGIEAEAATRFPGRRGEIQSYRISGGVMCTSLGDHKIADGEAYFLMANEGDAIGLLNADIRLRGMPEEDTLRAGTYAELQLWTAFFGRWIGPAKIEDVNWRAGRVLLRGT